MLEKENKFLHIGCGSKNKYQTTKYFSSEAWQEIRFDIDPNANPDLIGTMTNMDQVPDSEFQALYSSHNIEHLYPHEVPVALTEFRRVLDDQGYVVITCPDLQSVCKLVAEDKLVESAYDSPAGPITPLDILYGHRASMSAGNLYMAHKCGFTLNVLLGTFKAAGFESVIGFKREAPYFDLFCIASKAERDDTAMRELLGLHFTL